MYRNYFCGSRRSQRKSSLAWFLDHLHNSDPVTVLSFNWYTDFTKIYRYAGIERDLQVVGYSLRESFGTTGLHRARNWYS
ncbi:hypothetical protein E2C01_080302 [Portunus trituberculatus]|uniref:Uncharacterized protein n=1 Tax=Portunus trituberculatus TaxID=210409 RepID=A0A5B7INY2_PORTR|nr:hypothetical protein [Portunus trituberculatus]